MLKEMEKKFNTSFFVNRRNRSKSDKNDIVPILSVCLSLLTKAAPICFIESLQQNKCFGAQLNYEKATY